MDNHAPEPTENFEIIQNNQEKYILVNNNGDKHLIYVKRCFCSFMKTTAKVGLLKTRRSIIRQDSTGKVLAKLSFTLHKEPMMFYFEYFDHSINNSQRLSISLLELRAGLKINWFEKFVQQLNTDKITLSTILGDVIDMFERIKFIKFHKKLLEKFNTEQRKRLELTFQNFMYQTPEREDSSSSEQSLSNLQEHKTVSVFKEKMYSSNKIETVLDSHSEGGSNKTMLRKIRKLTAIYQEDTGSSKRKETIPTGKKSSDYYAQCNQLERGLTNNPLGQVVCPGYTQQSVSGNQYYQLPVQRPTPYIEHLQRQSYPSADTSNLLPAHPMSNNPHARPSLYKTTQETQQRRFSQMQDDRAHNIKAKGKRPANNS